VITASADAQARRVLADTYALSPRRTDEPAPAARDRQVERDPATGRWLGPFVMADYNSRLVRLSNTLTDWSYGRGLRYREVSDFGRAPVAPVLATGMALGLGALSSGMSWAPTRAVLDRFLPAPGEGPTAAQRAAGSFRLEISTVTTTGARYRTTVAADHDPGYGGTAIMLGESALCLALDEKRLPARSGVLTPATAMGDALVDRLRAHGFTFEVERLG